MCFNARTEAQRTQGEGAFNYRLKIPFSTETGTGEVNWRDFKLGGLFFAETGLGEAKNCCVTLGGLFFAETGAGESDDLGVKGFCGI